MSERRRPRPHRDPRARRDEGGFTLIELMVAMTVFSVMLVGFTLLLNASLKAYRFARARTIAESLASGEIDKARSVSWTNLGLVNGNPPGTLVGEEDVLVGASKLHVSRKVELVDDNIPTYGYGTGANYKKVVVTVSSAAMTVPVVYETIVAPPTQPSLYSANVEASVFDTCRLGTSGGVFPGATVTIANGPSATRSDVTNSSGVVRFAALKPTNTSAPGNFYDVSATATGWQMLEPLTASTLHFALDPGNTAQPQMELYKPATVNVHLVDMIGQPVTSDYSLNATNWLGASMPAVNGRSATGTVVLPTFGTASFVPCKSYTFTATSLGYTTQNPAPVPIQITGYPDTTTLDVTVRIPIPARTTTTFHLVDSVTNAPLAGVSGVVKNLTNTLEPDLTFTTAADGSATLQLLPYSFRVTTTGPVGYFGGSFDYTVAIPTGNTAPAPADQTLALVPVQYTDVVVTTKDSTGAVMGGITVVADAGTQGTTTFTTDPTTGQATVRLPQATLTLKVTSPPTAYQPYSSTFTVTATTLTRDVTLALTGAVTISTRSAATAALVPSVDVVATNTATNAVTTISSGSTGSVSTFLLPGRYTLAVANPPTGYGTVAATTVDVPSGAFSTTLNLPLPDVVFTARNTVSNAAIGSISLTYTQTAGGTATGTVVLAANGLATVKLAPGTYKVDFAGDTSYKVGTTTATITGTNAETIALPLEPKTTTVVVQFQVDKSSGSSRSWSFNLTGPSGTVTVSHTATNTPSGNYTLVPGTYTISNPSYPGSSSCRTFDVSSITVTTAKTYKITCVPE